MEYKSKYKAEEIEAILDAKNNTGEAVDETLDGLFVDALQTKEIELSESAEITPDEGFLGLKKVNVTVKGGDAPSGGSSWKYYNVADSNALGEVGLFFLLMKYTYKGSTYIASMIDYHSSRSLTVHSIAIDENIKINLEGTVMTALEWLAALGDLSAVGFTEITEEQFYTI